VRSRGLYPAELIHSSKLQVLVLSLMVFLIFSSNLYAAPSLLMSVSEQNLLTKVLIRDIEAGSSINTVLNKASLNGLNQEKVVRDLLKVGLSPSHLVYVAIIEGYEVEAVVVGAIKEGIDTRVLFTALISAGTSPVEMARPLIGLGANPEEVADLLASVSAVPRTKP
ncbi:MAG: hypothetical protein KAT46_03275, partial [Deltaproteobacteria bacterium]|nr:hypothetical protein [Deltaproteobacteria bacterium]